MERYQYCKSNISDITYMSELILDIFDVKDLIRANNPETSGLCAH
jgi:hypothetical protein